MRTTPLVASTIYLFVAAAFASEAAAVVEGEPIEIRPPRNRAALYHQLDLLEDLAGEIRLQEAEIESLRRQLERYESYGGSPAFLVSRQHVRLQLLEARLRLRQLKRQRLLLQLRKSSPRIGGRTEALDRPCVGGTND